MVEFDVTESFAKYNIKIYIMRNIEQTIENMVGKSPNTFICYIDEDGLPCDGKPC